MLEHGATDEVVCFAMDHEGYGQEIGCAVRLVAGQSLDDQQLKQWLRGRIAYFKIPAKIWFVEEIPKTATGKLQRRALGKIFAG